MSRSRARFLVRLLDQPPAQRCADPACLDCIEDYPTRRQRLVRAGDQLATWWHYRDELPSTVWNLSLWPHLWQDALRARSRMLIALHRLGWRLQGRPAPRVAPASVERIINEVIAEMDGVALPPWTGQALTVADLDAAVEAMRQAGVDVVPVEPNLLLFPQAPEPPHGFSASRFLRDPQMPPVINADAARRVVEP